MSKKARPAVSNQGNDAAAMRLFELFNEIGIINQLATTRFERALPHGLTTSQFSVLNHFVRLGGTRSPKQLADAFQVTKAAMTNTLGKLADKGFVRVRQSRSDGRAKEVTLTASGRKARERAIALAGVAMADLQQQISVRHAEELLEPLRIIRTYLDTHRENK